MCTCQLKKYDWTLYKELWYRQYSLYKSCTEFQVRFLLRLRYSSHPLTARRVVKNFHGAIIRRPIAVADFAVHRHGTTIHILGSRSPQRCGGSKTDDNGSLTTSSARVPPTPAAGPSCAITPWRVFDLLLAT